MTLQQRHNIKQEWFKGVETIREIPMPNDARFFVGQEVIHDDRVYEIVGYYDYFGKYPTYLAWCWSNGSPTGIPLAVQDDMYLKSEAHLHPHAKIRDMKYKELSIDIIGTCMRKLQEAHLTKPEFLDCMCEIYMRTILGYCKAEHLDPLETLTLFHQKCEEISLKGHDEAKKELETRRLS